MAYGMEMREKIDWNDKSISNLFVQRNVLKFIGVWPSSEQNFLTLARWFITLLVQITTICSLSLEVYRHCLNTDDTMDAFIVDLSSVASISKHISLRYNLSHTYALVNSTIDDWSGVQDPRRRDVMRMYFRRGRIVSLMILYLGYASATSIVLKNLPLETVLPTQIFGVKLTEGSFKSNATLSTTYFLATYCAFAPLPIFVHGPVLALQAMQMFANAVCHCGSDGFFFTLMMHLCAQFEILKMDFAEMETDEEGFRRRFRILIRRHCRLVRLADSLEQAFNMVILVQLLMSALLLCVVGFQLLLALKVNNNTAATKHAILIVTMLVQLYIYAYAGDALESRSQEIAFAVYNSPWPEFPAHAARDLTLVMLRGNTPQHVTAGKFLSMNLSTFKEILKTSASYMSVLRVMLDA